MQLGFRKQWYNHIHISFDLLVWNKSFLSTLWSRGWCQAATFLFIYFFFFFIFNTKGSHHVVLHLCDQLCIVPVPMETLPTIGRPTDTEFKYFLLLYHRQTESRVCLSGCHASARYSRAWVQKKVLAQTWSVAVYICNKPISQIPEFTCSISHNAPFRTEMCTFLFWMEHCGIWDRCILGFVN